MLGTSEYFYSSLILKVLAPPACHAPFTPAPQYKVLGAKNCNCNCNCYHRIGSRMSKLPEHQPLTGTKWVKCFLLLYFCILEFLYFCIFVYFCQAADPAKHWLLRTNPRQMSNQTIQTVDEVFRWLKWVGMRSMLIKASIDSYSRGK